MLSLGSNIEDRMAHLRIGIEVLRPSVVSPVYESEPWGGVEQAPFLNVVVLAPLGAAAAWRAAQDAEARAGRVRDGTRWGPRTLDVDVVTASGVDPALVLPHPHAHERAFVLQPWLDVEPHAELPGYGSIAVLAARLSGQVRRRDDLVLA